MLLSTSGEVVRQLVAFSVEAQYTLSNKLLSTVLPAKCCLVYVGLNLMRARFLSGDTGGTCPYLNIWGNSISKWSYPIIAIKCSSA